MQITFKLTALPLPSVRAANGNQSRHYARLAGHGYVRGLVLSKKSQGTEDSPDFGRIPLGSLRGTDTCYAGRCSEHASHHGRSLDNTSIEAKLAEHQFPEPMFSIADQDAFGSRAPAISL